MSDDLLHFYERELDALGNLASEYAATRPKIAARLGLSATAVKDPHVSRLIEAVAFLNARIRQKLDDEFPELTHALLGALYPHYLAPIPSMAIAQFDCDPQATAAYRVKRGSWIETERVLRRDDAHRRDASTHEESDRGERCTFRTAYPVDAWPLVIKSERFVSPTLVPVASRGGATSVLEIVLECAGSQKLGELRPSELRFFLAGNAKLARGLYELLFRDALEIVLATSRDDATPARLPRTCLRPVGFEREARVHRDAFEAQRDQGLLPYPPQSFLGYRLLTELFAFPEKFLFVDLVDLPTDKLAAAGKSITIYVPLKRASDELAKELQAASAEAARKPDDKRVRAPWPIALGCTPIVNLFRHPPFEVAVEDALSEVHVLPDDGRRAAAIEIYSVDRISIVSTKERKPHCTPFFGLERAAEDGRPNVWWHASRRAAPPDFDVDKNGTETWLTLVDHGRLDGERQVSLLVDATCTNRNLPNDLPKGGDRPYMSLLEAGAIQRVRAIAGPTPTLRPLRGDDALWKLVSHLTLNQDSLAGTDPTAALKAILHLYDFAAQSPDSPAKLLIDGLESVECERATLRTVIDGQPALVRGTLVRVKLDARMFLGGGAYLFACVLERFLGLFAGLNSYVQLVVVPFDRQTKQLAGEPLTWPPRAGDRPLI